MIGINIKRIIGSYYFKLILIFLATRLILGFFGVMSFNLMRPYDTDYVWKFDKNEIVDVWAVWDSGFYLNIAEQGYSSVPSAREETDGQANYAFFPLYPLMIKLGVLIGLRPVYAGILISNLCLFLSSFVLFRLMLLKNDEKTAFYAVLFLYAFPTAFVFSSLYSESLFILLALLMYYHLKKGKFLVSGLFGMLAALTRSIGVVLIIPMLIEIYISKKPFYIKLSNYIQSLLIPLGTFLYVTYIRTLTGSFFSIFSIQSAWGRKIQNPFVLLLEGFRSDLFQVKFTAFFTLFIVILLFVLISKLSRDEFLLSILLLFIPLSSELMSMPRYALVIFPLYMGLAKLMKDNNALGLILLIIFSITQGVMLVFWTTGSDLLM